MKTKKEGLEYLKELKKMIKAYKDEGQTAYVENLEWVYGEWEREIEAGTLKFD